jgi:hypothetical protein
MKSTLPPTIICILCGLAIGSEPLREGQKLVEIKTEVGNVYKNVTIRKIEPHGLKIFHESGATTIPAAQLPQFRDQFGSDEEITLIQKQLESEESKWHHDQSKILNKTEKSDPKNSINQQKLATAMHTLLEKAASKKAQDAKIEAARRDKEAQWYAENPHMVPGGESVISRYANAKRAAGEMDFSGQENPAQRARDFRTGFKAGYKKADPRGIPPLPPLPEIGHYSYEDGFGVGYAQGLADGAAGRKSRQ